MINERGMLVVLNTGKWSARMHDRKVSDSVTREANAAVGVGSFNKRMLPSSALAPVTSVINSARKYHNTVTVPWTDDGQRLLPVTMSDQYKKQMDDHIVQFGDSVNNVLKDYAYWRMQAGKELGDLYDESEYPSQDDLRDMLYLSYDINPIPEADHLVVELDKQSIEQIKADINKKTSEKLGVAVGSLYKRINDIILMLQSKLEDNEDGSTKVIRASVLEKVAEVVDIVPDLNLTNDENLNKICEDLRRTVEGVKVENLRQNSSEFDKDTKDQVSESLDEIAEKMSGMF